MADGIGCTCCAYSECECCCPDVDWTPQELIDARERLVLLEQQVQKLEVELELAYNGAAVTNNSLDK